MALAAQTANETLQIKHFYTYTPQQVFDAWINEESVGQWFGPESHNCKVEEYDFREGGRYKLRLVLADANSTCNSGSSEDAVCVGEFVRILPGKQIAMTFTWLQDDIGDTLLTVDFDAVKGGTEVTLTHERLPNEASRKAHEGGWTSTLVCLENYLGNTIAQSR